MAAPPEVHIYHPFSLIDGDGNFNENIGKDLDLAHENCVSVSIIGVQSSGKSTLLNKCFSTNFQEMDENQGMSQTTKGIWIAKVSSPNRGPKILLIDIEGSDSLERGREGDDSFERKSAAFALAMSNTVIVNMECKSVGLQNGASRPLLKTVFQVMLDKFTSTPRKVNLMFVLRDKIQSPLDTLEKQLRKGLDEIWRGISRSEANREAKLKDSFNVVVMTMSHYVYRREEFDKEVVSVKQRLLSLVNLGQSCPASKFFDDAKSEWGAIRKTNILNVNLNKVTVDRILCQNIMKENSEKFRHDTNWLQKKKDVESGKKVPGFGEHVNRIMEKYLSQYHKDTSHTDERTRNHYKNELTKNLSEVVEPSYLALGAKMREATLEEFVEEIAKVIERRGKFENIKSDTFLDKFEGCLKDARVEHARCTHTSPESEKIKSELNSYEEGARNIMKWLKTLEQNKVTALVDCIKVAAFAAAVGAAMVAPPVGLLAGTTALGLGVAVPLPAISVGSIIQALVKYVETKEHIGRERKDRPEVDKIMKALESNKKKENKDRK